MLYMILATDTEDSQDIRQQARPDHLARLDSLQKENRLVLAGRNPLPDNDNQCSGSLIVADFDSLDDAEAWASDDPFVHAGVYAEILIKPFIQALP